MQCGVSDPLSTLDGFVPSTCDSVVIAVLRYALVSRHNFTAVADATRVI